MRSISIALVACLGGLLARPAAAQGPAADDAGLVTEGGIPPRSVVWSRWSLFDPYLSRREFVLSGGYVSEWQAGAQGPRSGIEATFGQTIESDAGRLFVRLEAEWGARATGDGHVVLIVPRYTYAAGAIAGPLEVSARAGAALAEIHVGSGGLGAGFLSPCVGVAAGVRLGPIRLGAAALSEYAWRWFGGPSARVEGVVVEATLIDRSRRLPPFYRVER